MKNPFIIAAMLAAAMSAAVRENAIRSAPGYKPQAGSSSRSRVAGKRNPAGAKIARKWIKATGIAWKGELVHTGALTQLNKDRALKRLGFVPPLRRQA
jgi:hypothetical protein